MNPPGKEVSALVRLGGVFVLIVVWAAWAPLDVAATAAGEVAPAGRVKAVQHLEGGIIAEITATEGERVSKGQLLFRLDSTRAQAETAEMTRRLRSLAIDIARLSAEISKSPDVVFDAEMEASAPELTAAARDLFVSRRERLAHEVRSQAQQAAQRQSEIHETQVRLRNNRRSLEIADAQVAISQNLLNKDLSNRMSHLEQLRQQQLLRALVEADEAAEPRLRAGLEEARERLAWIEGAAVEQARRDLADFRRQFDEMSQRMNTLRDVEARTMVRAPVDGILKSVQVATEGGVVQPGQVLAEIVPEADRLVIEARLPVQDIGYVQIGQAVRVSLNSTDASVFAPLDGVVDRVSPDATSTSDGRSYYKFRVVTTQSAFSGAGRRYSLYPGMQLTCSVLIGRRTVMEYLLSPWSAAMRFAFQER
jgi:membrane fusion protein, adhesin transport system